MVITIQRKSDNYYWNGLTPAWQSGLVTNAMTESKSGLYTFPVTVAQGFFTGVTGGMYITYYSAGVISFSKDVDTYNGAPAPYDMATTTNVAAVITALESGHIIL
jgi:hypothetical protein